VHERDKKCTKFWSENLKGKDLVDDFGLDRTLMIHLIIKLWGGRVWTGAIWLRLRASGGYCEHDNEPSGPMKGD
jgi:hypothetical protein